MQPIHVFCTLTHEAMFHSLFNLNPNLWPFPVHVIDNRRDNLTIPVRYNAVIDQYIDQDVWLYFVHEDFAIRGDLRPATRMPQGAIYGSFGVRMEGHLPIPYGAYPVCQKDGSNRVTFGLPFSEPMDVDTLDCNNILVHTSLLREHPSLRFDENLHYDLYAEDLCMQAKRIGGIPVRAFPLDCQHYSLGNIGDGYRNDLKYLASKYPDDAAPGTASFVGGASGELEKYFTYDVPAGKV